MGNKIPRPPEMPPEAPQPAKKKTGLYIGIVLIGIIVIGAIAVIASNPSFVPRTKITQIQIKVEYSGEWQGAYGDQTGISSWSGQGPKTITLNRPSQAEAIWIISANAQKMDGSGNTLRLMITKTDGTILKEGSTNAAYGVAQIAYTIQD